MIRRPSSPPEPVPGDPEPGEAPAPAPAVKLTKRQPVAAPDPAAGREKVCATCGTRFHLEAGKKYFLCPDCYRRSVEPRAKGGRNATRILTHITCAACGAEEYVPFVPEDPAKALCKACFAAGKAEPKPSSRHPRR